MSMTAKHVGGVLTGEACYHSRYIAYIPFPLTYMLTVTMCAPTARRRSAAKSGPAQAPPAHPRITPTKDI